MNKLLNFELKSDLPKQEQVVLILWKFAYNLQKYPDTGQVVELGDRIQLNLVHVREAIKEIMEVFGYDAVKLEQFYARASGER